GIVMVRAKCSQRLDGNALALPTRETGGLKDDPVMIREAPRRLQRGDPLWCDARACEARDINAARHDPQSCFFRSVPPRDEIARVARVRDDAVAPRHDAVIKALRPVALAVGAVECRDERNAGAACCREAAPGWRPACRIDQRYATRANETGQSADVGDH